MHIVYITYWGINDGLSVATVYPQLNILDKNDAVNKISVLSIERGNSYHKPNELFSDKVSFHPLIEKPDVSWEKLFTLKRAVKLVLHICQQNKVSLIIARSSMAGIIALKVYNKLKVPFAVESLEPHASYMVDAGVWKNNGVKHRYLNYYENKIYSKALALLPVSFNFKRYLIEKGVDENKIIVMPCCLQISNFEFKTEDRKRVRKNIGFEEDNTVGIYVGKFGGIYYHKHSFALFEFILSNDENARLIILTPQKEEVSNYIEERLYEYKDRIYVNSVSSDEVASYLSAADYSFALYKQFESNKYLSPIKIGEYLANDLKVVLTKGVGDESNMLKAYPEMGVELDLEGNLWKNAIKGFLGEEDNTVRDGNGMKLAEKYRGSSVAVGAYTRLLNKLLS